MIAAKTPLRRKWTPTIRLAHTAIAALAVALVTSVVASIGQAAAPPVGHIPNGPTAAVTTDQGELVAVALPHRRNGRNWRLVENSGTRVLTEVTEADVGAQVVVVFKAVARGQATVVFALTRAEQPKVYESRRFAIHVR